VGKAPQKECPAMSDNIKPGGGKSAGARSLTARVYTLGAWTSRYL
jgi:hypothetical protein